MVHIRYHYGSCIKLFMAMYALVISSSSVSWWCPATRYSMIPNAAFAFVRGLCLDLTEFPYLSRDSRLARVWPVWCWSICPSSSQLDATSRHRRLS